MYWAIHSVWISFVSSTLTWKASRRSSSGALSFVAFKPYLPIVYLYVFLVLPISSLSPLFLLQCETFFIYACDVSQ